MAVAKPITASGHLEDPTRRNLLTVMATMGAGLAMPVHAAPENDDTRVLHLFRRHYGLTMAAEAHPSLDDGELDRLFYNERDSIEAEIMSLPSTCAADFAAKMLVSHAYGQFSCLYQDAPVWTEAKELAGIPKDHQ